MRNLKTHIIHISEIDRPNGAEPALGIGPKIRVVGEVQFDGDRGVYSLRVFVFNQKHGEKGGWFLCRSLGLDPKEKSKTSKILRYGGFSTSGMTELCNLNCRGKAILELAKSAIAEDSPGWAGEVVWEKGKKDLQLI